ncbi:hypothetical protein KFU94_12380 [Chloroflexi bacterium TSY]|nr:hypothetical protein [Chloroflexi bacterium TSY]
MIEQTHALGALPIRWITMDEAFGKDTHLLDCIDGQTAYSYFAEVPKETRVWTSSPRPICPHHLDAGAKLKLRVRPGEPTPLTVAQLADTFQEHGGNSMFSKRAPRASSLLPLLVAALSLSAMGSPVLLSGSSSAAIPIALCNTFSQCTLRLPWMTSPLFLLCVGPLKPFLNKPSSFSDSTNMKLAVGSVGIII